jgi:hypothetical protein
MISCSNENNNAISSYLFYFGSFGSLHFVDPFDPTNSFVIDSGPINHDQAVGIFCGIPNYITHSISSYNLGTIVYIRDGKFWRISTLKGAPKTPVQVSSESNAGNDQILYEITDYANPENSRIIYLVGSSESLESQFMMISLGMTPDDIPVNIAIGPLPLVWTIYNKDGSILGFLATYGRVLGRYDADFNHVIDIAPFNSTCNVGIYDNAIYLGNLVPVVIDGTLRFVNLADNSITDIIYIFSSQNWYGIEEEDGANYYFVDGSKIIIVPGDAVTAPSVLVDEDPTNVKSIWRLSYTANKVTYMLDYGAIKSVPKTGGTPIVVAFPPAGQNVLLTYVDWASGNLYYGTYLPSSSNPFSEPVSAGMVKDDGSAGLAPISPAGWIGEGFDRSIPYSTDHPSSKYIFLVRDYTNFSVTGFANGTVESYNVPSAAMVACVGTVPSDIVSLTLSFFGSSDGFLAAGANENGYGDIFFLNGANNDSMIRLTNTPTVDETVIFVPSSSLMGFIGFVDSSP